MRYVLVAALLLVASVTHGACPAGQDDYWALLYQPKSGPDTDALALKAEGLKGVESAVKFGEITEATWTELTDRLGLIYDAVETTVEAQRTGGVTVIDKAAREYLARHVQRMANGDEESLDQGLKRRRPGEDWWLIIQMCVDDTLTPQEKTRLRDILLESPAIMDVMAAP